MKLHSAEQTPEWAGRDVRIDYVYRAEWDRSGEHVPGMGISVIYTVARIIISSRFQFLGNKNMGNVILFALQINHLDPLLNMFINPKYCGRSRR